MSFTAERQCYPPNGVTKGIWADRAVAEGSQHVMAANCCPDDHWQQGKKKRWKRQKGEIRELVDKINCVNDINKSSVNECKNKH